MKVWVKSHKRNGKNVRKHYKTVKSSLIKTFSYDTDLQDLKIKFKRKTKQGVDTYLYADVPEKVVKGFEDAPSKGTYFHKKINPKYIVSKLK